MRGDEESGGGRLLNPSGAGLSGVRGVPSLPAFLLLATLSFFLGGMTANQMTNGGRLVWLQGLKSRRVSLMELQP